MGLREKHKADRRKRILRAAKRIIVRHGVAALSMRELARQARVTVPTVYNLVGSKVDVLYELFAEALDALNHSLDSLQAADPIDRAYALTEAVNDLITSDTEFHRPLINAILRLGDPRRNVPVVERSMKANVEIYREAAQAGIFRDGGMAIVMGRQAFLNYNHALRLWSWGVLNDEEFRAQTLCGVTVCMLAVASEPFRPRLIHRLAELAPRLLNAYPLGPAQESEEADRVAAEEPVPVAQLVAAGQS